MWDDPQALRKLSGTLLGISLLLVLFGAVHYAIHLPLFALRTVQLDSVPRHVDVAQLEAVLRRELHGNFFTVDLAQVRGTLEQLPWVHKATVQRHFPWQLDVKLEEQVVLATWNGSSLVNVQGEVFDAGNTKADVDGQALPAFVAPEGSSAEVAERYESFNSALAPLSQQIDQITLSPRQAWQLHLRNGMVLELGREQMEQRLKRFVAAYPYSLAQMASPAKYIDLRYRNGFAARMAG